MISFALESPWFESHTDILSLCPQCHFFYVVSVITARQRTLLMKILSVITSSVIDYSHTWDKKIPFYGCQRFFCLGLLVSS